MIEISLFFVNMLSPSLPLIYYHNLTVKKIQISKNLLYSQHFYTDFIFTYAIDFKTHLIIKAASVKKR